MLPPNVLCPSCLLLPSEAAVKSEEASMMPEDVTFTAVIWLSAYMFLYDRKLEEEEEEEASK